MIASYSTQYGVSPEDAARELLKRRRARQHLLDFTTYTKPDYEVQWFNKLIADVLTRVVFGLLPKDDPRFLVNAPKRVIICQPPQTGKTELASRRLPAFALGINPDMRVIASSYAAELASLINRDVQQIIDDTAYGRVFPHTRLNSSNVRTTAYGQPLRNSDIFEVVGYKGRYKSAGVGGAITGMSGDLGIIDDPFKNRKDADSEAYRLEVKRWYASTFRPRLGFNPNAAIVIMHTRWHDDDLIGWLLELEATNSKADRWIVINLPAELDYIPDADKEPKSYEAYITFDKRELGALLWPDRFTRDALEAIRANDPDDYEALYMQRPVKPGGEMFPREKFVLLEDVQLFDNMTLVRYWDKAGTKDAGAYTAGVLMCYDPDRRYGVNFIVLDVARGQKDPFTREQLIKQVTQLDYSRYKDVIDYTVWLEQEPGSSGKESAMNTTINTLAGYPVEYETASGDKVVRAKPLSSQVKAGNVGLLIGDWTQDYLHEVGAFPGYKFKDQVDGSSGGFNKLSLGWNDEAIITVYNPLVISPF